MLRFVEAGSGPPLVLLHPFPVDGRIYQGVLAAAEEGRLAARVIVPDLIGFGATPLPQSAPEMLDLDTLADHVQALLASLGLRHAIVGGTAIGGYVGLEIVRRSAPALVAGLVLIACKPEPGGRADDQHAIAEMALTQGSAAVARELAGRPLSPRADRQLTARVATMIEDADPRAIAALARGLASRPDPTECMRALRLPALLVAGGDDAFTLPERVAAAAALIEGATLVELAGAGHYPPLERPDELVAALSDFVATVTGAVRAP